ncbi:MAG: hypothetical protein R3E31_02700 [Chloroflexota bacterium]
MTKKRKQYSQQFKFKVALEATQELGAPIFIGTKNQSHLSCHGDKHDYAIVFDSKHGQMPLSAFSTKQDCGKTATLTCQSS